MTSFAALVLFAILGHGTGNVENTAGPVLAALAVLPSEAAVAFIDLEAVCPPPQEGVCDDCTNTYPYGCDSGTGGCQPLQNCVVIGIPFPQGCLPGLVARCACQ
jgi:hypothetical protein